MIRPMAGAIALVLTTTAVPGQEGVPDGTLRRFKDATVYVKVEAGTGSGFLARVEGDAGYIVTNHHVASGRIGERVQVVFFAGTSEEREMLGAIVANNPERDLALLKVEAKELPKPVDYKSRAELKDGMPILVL